MSALKTRTNIVSTFLANWTDTLVYVDNVHADPDVESPFVVITTVPTSSNQPCLGRDPGETWERELGDVVLGVHVPVNSDVDGLYLAEQARLTIAQQRFEETILDVGYIVPAGIGEDKRYYVWNVRIEYRTDNIKEEL